MDSCGVSKYHCGPPAMGRCIWSEKNGVWAERGVRVTRQLLAYYLLFEVCANMKKLKIKKAKRT
jgi:hypothetical protein